MKPTLVALLMVVAVPALAGDGTFTGFLRDLGNPGATDRAHREADAAKCGRFGFRPGSDAFASCLMEQDRQRETARKPVRITR